MLAQCRRRRASIKSTLAQYLMVAGYIFNPFRGFIKLKKIREKLGSGWVGQAPAQIFFGGGGDLVVFFGFFCCTYFQKQFKNLDRGWVGGVWPIRVFLGFLDLFW